MQTIRVAALGVAALLLASAAQAKTTGFQLELLGLGAQPTWSGSSGTAGFGGGTNVKLLFGLSRRLLIGGSVAYFKNDKDYAYAVFLPGPPVGGVRAPRFRGQFLGGPGHRVLSTLPVEGFIQLRSDRTKTLNGYAEIGGGVTTTNAKVTVGANSLAAKEEDPSMMLGAGVIYGLGRNWEFTAAVDWHQAWSPGGPVWRDQDSPRFITFGVGVRYPKF